MSPRVRGAFARNALFGGCRQPRRWPFLAAARSANADSRKPVPRWAGSAPPPQRRRRTRREPTRRAAHPWPRGADERIGGALPDGSGDRRLSVDAGFVPAEAGTTRAAKAAAARLALSPPWHALAPVRLLFAPPLGVCPVPGPSSAGLGLPSWRLADYNSATDLEHELLTDPRSDRFDSAPDSALELFYHQPNKTGS